MQWGPTMSAETLLIILLVGLIAGWLAGQIVRGTGFGLIADIAIGCFDRELVATSFGHPSWIWNRSGDHRSYHRRDHPAFDSKTGLPSRALVIDRRRSHGYR
jgi:hypothetical protein